MRPVKVSIVKNKNCESVTGDFHQWGAEMEEFENGPGVYTVGIVELKDGSIVTPLPQNIQFLDRVS